MVTHSFLLSLLRIVTTILELHASQDAAHCAMLSLYTATAVKRHRRYYGPKGLGENDETPQLYVTFASCTPLSMWPETRGSGLAVTMISDVRLSGLMRQTVVPHDHGARRPLLSLE